jgi:hypothetical protein
MYLIADEVSLHVALLAMLAYVQPRTIRIAWAHPTLPLLDSPVVAIDFIIYEM